MTMVDMMRYRDKDGDEGNGEDGGENGAGLIPNPLVAPPSTLPLPLTYLLQPILTVIQFYIIFIIILI